MIFSLGYRISGLMIRFRDTRVHDAQMNHAGNVTQGTAPFIEAQTSKIDQAQTVLAAAETKAKRMGERIEFRHTRGSGDRQG